MKKQAKNPISKFLTGETAGAGLAGGLGALLSQGAGALPATAIGGLTGLLGPAAMKGGRALHSGALESRILRGGKGLLDFEKDHLAEGVGVSREKLNRLLTSSSKRGPVKPFGTIRDHLGVIQERVTGSESSHLNRRMEDILSDAAGPADRLATTKYNPLNLPGRMTQSRALAGRVADKEELIGAEQRVMDLLKSESRKDTAKRVGFPVAAAAVLGGGALGTKHLLEKESSVSMNKEAISSDLVKKVLDRTVRRVPSANNAARIERLLGRIGEHKQNLSKTLSAETESASEAVRDLIDRKHNAVDEIQRNAYLSKRRPKGSPSVDEVSAFRERAMRETVDPQFAAEHMALNGRAAEGRYKGKLRTERLGHIEDTVAGALGRLKKESSAVSPFLRGFSEELGHIKQAGFVGTVAKTGVGSIVGTALGAMLGLTLLGSLLAQSGQQQGGGAIVDPDANPTVEV